MARGECVIISDKDGNLFRHNILRTAVANFAVPFVGFATAPILARTLGVEGRGELAAITAPLMLLTAIATFGIPESVTFFIGRNTRIFRSAVRLASLVLVLAGLGAAVGLFLLAPVLSGGDEQLVNLMRIASLVVLPTMALAGLRGAASGTHSWRIINSEKYISALLRGAGILSLAVLGALNVGTALLVITFGPVIAGLVYLRLKVPTVRQTRRLSARSLFGYGSRVWVGSMSGLVLSKIDQVLMIPLSGAFQLGLYAAAATMSDLALLVNNAVRDVVFASESGEQSPARLHTASRVSFLLSLSICIAMCSTAYFWFPLVFGDEFSDGIVVVIILTIAATLGVPGSVAGAGLSARGRPGLRSLALIVAAVVNILILVLLLPSMGALGAAMATLAGNLIASNFNIIAMKYIFGMSISGFYVLRKSDFVLICALFGKFIRRDR